MGRITTIRTAACLCSLLLALAACAPRPTATIALGGTDVTVYVADTPEERSTGLQGYDGLADGEGMLFVFDDEAVRTFAMKDVSFPIDVVFIDAELRVSAIEPLDPGDTRLVAGPGPSPYVIELPQGWADSHGIAVGSVLVVGE